MAGDVAASHARSIRPDPTDAVYEQWELVERAQQGDSEAFGRIYRQHVDTVFRYVFFRVGSRPLAEDLTSETFTRALTRISSFTWQGRDLSSWLITVARNLVADHFRSHHYRREISAGNVLDVDQQERGPEGFPEGLVLGKVDNAAMVAAIQKLPVHEQTAVVVVYLQEQSLRQAAQILNVPERTVAARLHRAKRSLARLLSEDPTHGNPFRDLAERPPVRLRGRQREIHTWVREQGLTVTAYAERAGIEPSTVRVHLMRAERALAAPNTAPSRQSGPPRRSQQRRKPTDLSTVDLSLASLMRLPIRQRQIIRLIANGANPTAVAAQLGIAPSTVRVHLHRAMHTLDSPT
ncbi:sigma-70 family RNA polymerase sigma factor [Longispora sp. NPDC051575]|uniref:sigma-70 family RNA polymerase sigma factor n=1 Tax=Longispora sp. NPDC051575 TaxID=3154943 RepID=UPI00342521C0